MMLRRWYKVKTILKLDELGFEYDKANKLYFKEYINCTISAKLYGFDLEFELRSHNKHTAEYFSSNTRNYKNFIYIIQDMFKMLLSKDFDLIKIENLNKMGISYSDISDRFYSNCSEYSKEFLLN